MDSDENGNTDAQEVTETNAATANDETPATASEGATAIASDSDDEEVTFSLPYQEVAGKMKNGKGFFYTPDNHLYRYLTLLDIC